MARAICYGQRGEIRKRYREGLEDQLGLWGWLLMQWFCETRSICRKC
ncbi:hypothetical protein FORC31_p402 (plasmid) [Escherichia coli]|nr:hypothetical protein FORC31_p402 [Escherichia coli]